MPAYLLYKGNGVALRDGETIIGRATGCTLRLRSSAVSRLHARMRVRGDRCVIEDLGSRNGTHVNRVRLSEPYELHPGDEVVIGGFNFTYVTDEEDALAEPITNVGAPPTEFAHEFGGEPTGGGPTAGQLEVLGSDRRAHRRHQIELPIRYDSTTMTVEAISRDLSFGGVFIQTSVLDQIGTRCNLTIYPSRSGGREIELRGCVRRVVDESNEEPLGVGVEFEDLSPQAVQWLHATLGELGPDSMSRR